MRFTFLAYLSLNSFRQFMGLLVCCVAIAPVQAGNVVVLNWEEYLAESVIDQWQQESGHTIEEVYFDSDEKRDAILIASRKHRIDVAVVDEVVASRFGETGLLLPLTEDNVPNLKHVDPFWRGRCGKYAVPYLWGTLGIVYRSDKVEQPTSWVELLKPSQAMSGHIGMLNDFTDTLAPALFWLGYSLNSQKKSELTEVFQLLKAQAPKVLTYEYPVTFLKSDPAANELYMAVAYSGDQYPLNEIAGKDDVWKFSVPKEGTVLWVDCLAIPSSAEHQTEALQLINFLTRPIISAENSEELYFATPVPAARELQSEEFSSTLEVYPPQSVLERSELYAPLSSESIELRLRITNSLINIHEASKAH